MNPKKTALVLGSFLGLFHLGWGLLVAMGSAQSLIDFIYTLHSLNNPFVVLPFDITRMIGLVVFTFAGGYVSGYAMAILWNKFHK